MRALLPGPVDDVPRVVARLQIGGTDLEPDDPGPPAPGVPVIWVNAALRMRSARPRRRSATPRCCTRPCTGSPRCRAFAVRDAEPERWAECWLATAVVVRDAGFTEVAPGTVTCAVR